MKDKIGIKDEISFVLNGTPVDATPITKEEESRRIRQHMDQLRRRHTLTLGDYIDDTLEKERSERSRSND
jgi:hypothetical protein